jgi:hypothetical protein
MVALSPAGVSLAEKLIPVGSNPAQGHAEVIAQGVTTLTQGNVVWRVTQDQAPAKAKKITQPGSGFVLADSGQMILFDSNYRDATRLAEGEAAFLPMGRKQSRQSTSDQPADYFNIEIVKANDDSNSKSAFQSESFKSLKGARDIDLVRDVLSDDDETTIPNSDGPVLILVTDGQVQINENGQPEAVELTKGQAATFDDEITLKASDADGGTFVVAVISQEVKLP